MLLVLKIAQKWLFPDDKDKKVTPAKGKRITLTKESNDTGQHSNSTHKDIQIGPLHGRTNEENALTRYTTTKIGGQPLALPSLKNQETKFAWTQSFDCLMTYNGEGYWYGMHAEWIQERNGFWRQVNFK